MKNFLKAFLVLTLALSLVFSFPFANASACWRDFNCNLTMMNGVGNYGANTRYYWVDTSAFNYLPLITNAVTSWVYTTGNEDQGNVTTPISITRTTVKSNSVFDVYVETTDSNLSGVIGHTEYFVNKQEVGTDDGPLQSWYWTKITLNSRVFPTLTGRNGMTADQCRQGSIAHEFGHAMGLAHPLQVVGIYSYHYPECVMCQLGDGRTTYFPTEEDLNSINHLYA